MHLIPRSTVAMIREPIERATIIAVAALVLAGIALIVATAAHHAR